MSVSNDDRTQPWAQWEIVNVTFNATANVDTQIDHTLTPPTPEHVNYIVLRSNGAQSIYHDATGTRRPWGAGYLILRSNVASAKATLLLTVSHSKRTLPF